MRTRPCPQLCATTVDDLVAAGKLVCPKCDAIDINLGCPLPQAAEEGFGAWLLDREHWPMLRSMVRELKSATRIPVFCKIRLLSTVEETVALCETLQARSQDLCSECHQSK
eukprot:1290410-Pleurochrysis_carterae.AAC.1